MSEHLSKRRVVVNTAYTAAAQVVSLLVSLIALPLFLDSYGTSVYGLFLLVNSVVALVAVLDFGVGTIITKEVAHCAAIDDRSSLTESISAGFLLYALFALVATVVLALVGLESATLFNVTKNEADLLRLMFFAQAAIQFLSLCSSPARHILAGFQRYGIVAVSSLIVILGSTLATVFVLVANQGPLVLVILSGAAMLLGNALLVLSMIAHVKRLHLTWKRPKQLPRIEAWRMLRLGFPLFLVQITGFFLKQQSDKIILGAFLSASALAFYEIASKLYSLATQSIDMATGALLPHVAGLHAHGAHARIQNTFLYGSRYLSLLLSPLLALMFVSAPSIVLLWCGPEYAVSGTIARLLLIVPVFWPFLVIGDSILIGSEQMKSWVPWSVASGLISVSLALILVQPFGLIGVAIASFLGAFFEIVFYLKVILKTTGVPVGHWGRIVALPGTCAVALDVLLYFLFKTLIPANSLFALLFLLCVSAIAGFAFIWFALLKRGERSMFLHALPRRTSEDKK